MDLKKYNVPLWYKAPNLIYRFSWIVVSLVFFESGIPFSSFVYRCFLKIYGANISKGVVIKPGVKIKFPKKLTIGEYSWIGERVWIDNLDHVYIGRNCCVSQGAYLLTGNHNFKKPNFDLITSPIYIEDQVWLGAFTKIAPGTLIRKNVVVGMGVFVKGDIGGDDRGKLLVFNNLVMYSKKIIR